MRGIKAAVPGRQLNVIGRVIESYAKRFGYGVVREYTGHGIGTAFHSGLIVPHYDAAPAYATVIEPGMTSMQRGQLLTDELYLEAIEEHGDEFDARMGAEAVYELLKSIELPVEVIKVREEMASTSSETNAS